MSLLESVIVVSEKAANIARICRQDRHLFQLLVQEKSGEEANPRFVRDFKTLADVLIQETVRYDIGKKFPSLAKYVHGEESNLFSNSLGETVKVQVLDSQDATSTLLKTVLNEDSHAAQLLAEAVHEDLNLTVVNTRKDDIPEEYRHDGHLGVWIDPIDSTSEYINGVEKKSDFGIYLSGLRCATVLIGVYDRITGKPIMGVINQPFYENVEGKWRGKCYWGVTDQTHTMGTSPVPSTGVICVSASEDERIKRKLTDRGYKLVEAAGAGYKILTVIEGLADAYVLTKDTTFQWDTCGPQAILECFGGGLIVYSSAASDGSFVDVNYRNPEPKEGEEEMGDKSNIDKFCNKGGIIAYNNLNVSNDILKALRE